jgi:hypothetical protein
MDQHFCALIDCGGKVLGWMFHSPGAELGWRMLLTQTTQLEVDKLCRLDVLGLADSDQLPVYEEFQVQLKRSPEGWYETGLPWKSHHPPLPTNEMGSRRRLENLLKRLKSSDRYDEYNDIIAQQLKVGVIEPATQNASGKEFYIPHKAVVKNTAESTKLRVVYDASARESRTKPSLNDCLHESWSLSTESPLVYPGPVSVPSHSTHWGS